MMGKTQLLFVRSRRVHVEAKMRYGRYIGAEEYHRQETDLNLLADT